MIVFPTRAAGLLAAALIFAAPATASADETNYAKLGRWSVAAVTNGANLAYCSADIDNGKVQLRLTTDGRSWRVGVPYYENKKKVEGYYGFGDAAEVASFTVTGDGWAFIAINGDQLNAFKSSPAFAINLDRGLQTWKLAGAGAALDKAAECARSRGAKQTVATGTQLPGSGRNCPAPGQYRSQNSARAVTVTFFNGSKRPANIYWIGYDGQWVKYHTLAPNKNVNQRTFATHPWVATDAAGNCYSEVFMPDPLGGAEGNNFQIYFD